MSNSNLSRRGFIASLLGLAATPLLALLPKRKSSVDDMPSYYFDKNGNVWRKATLRKSEVRAPRHISELIRVQPMTRVTSRIFYMDSWDFSFAGPKFVQLELPFRKGD